MQPVCTAGLAMYVPFGTGSRKRCVSQTCPEQNRKRISLRSACSCCCGDGSVIHVETHAVRDVPTFKSARGVDNMKTGTQNEIEGKVHELKGDVKHKVGQVTNSPGLEAEGVTEKIAGKIQKKIGRVQKAVAKP
jgi:uncharacterized protein YjbJ (UPF0337 family)